MAGLRNRGSRRIGRRNGRVNATPRGSRMTTFTRDAAHAAVRVGIVRRSAAPERFGATTIEFVSPPGRSPAMPSRGQCWLQLQPWLRFRSPWTRPWMSYGAPRHPLTQLGARGVSRLAAGVSSSYSARCAERRWQRTDRAVAPGAWEIGHRRSRLELSPRPRVALIDELLGDVAQFDVAMERDLLSHLAAAPPVGAERGCTRLEDPSDMRWLLSWLRPEADPGAGRAAQSFAGHRSSPPGASPTCVDYISSSPRSPSWSAWLQRPWPTRTRHPGRRR
jgi:hypothetical protein